MTKAILKFNLPEENEEFQDAINGCRYHSILRQIDEQLRQKIKYEIHSEQEKEIFDSVRHQINYLLEKENLSLF